MLVWNGIARTIQIGGEAADILEPHVSGKATRAIVDRLDPRFYVDDEGRPWLVMLRASSHIGDRGENWSAAGIAEITRDDVVLARGDFVYPMVGHIFANFMNFYEVFPLEWVDNEAHRLTKARRDGASGLRAIPTLQCGISSGRRTGADRSKCCRRPRRSSRGRRCGRSRSTWSGRASRLFSMRASAGRG